MAVKTEFSKQQFIEILSDYTLGDFTAFKPITAGTVQTNFLLQTTQGTFVFRYYENRSMGSVLFESDLTQYLKKKRYPCPAPLKNSKGRYVGTHNEKPYIIFEFVEGQHLENPDAAQTKQLIQKVAELQNLTRNYKPRHTKYRWNYDLALCQQLAREEADKINTVQAKEKLAWFEHELSQLILPRSLPKGICHCDFHFSNILFQNGEFKALIDFDDANYTFLMYDLATLIDPFLPSFDWNSWSHFKPGENVFDFSAASQTVMEYTRHRPLNNNEKSHLYDVFKLSIMFDCVWYFKRGDAKDFYEKRKIAALNDLGREHFHAELFGKQKRNVQPKRGDGKEGCRS
ncbi:homoserine kinase [Dictyobacter kobayashii]|uniref:Aminoglycoside phosphotransferase domain-containing protein n=1 Tax=Dictyobacter kobayashii TaxID=2014872 RepID=A0A402AYB8_9CHLR|nr:homoserine kinase [Dictyobacter kobayashii]GCE24067.1 hypothetical protein KDK_78670 [Dictyobacter kobayashii]